MNCNKIQVKEEKSIPTDLHVHTIYSDGSNTPDEIFEYARTLGIRNLAFTDHDTTHWLNQHGIDAVHKAETFGISLVRGIEISARDFKTGKKAHILGYWPGCESFVPAHIQPLCKIIQERRTSASLKQIEVLQRLGYPITASEVWDNCEADQIFKHHVLKTLKEKGLIGDVIGEFYRQHFREGGDCFFEIEYVSAQEAVEAIRNDHGYPVLAHPGQQNNYDSIPDLVSSGLWGVEYLHPTHSIEDMAKIREISEEYHLYKTAGSDFHGEYHRGRKLGTCSLSNDDRNELISVGLLNHSL